MAAATLWIITSTHTQKYYACTWKRARRIVGGGWGCGVRVVRLSGLRPFPWDFRCSVFSVVSARLKSLALLCFEGRPEKHSVFHGRHNRNYTKVEISFGQAVGLRVGVGISGEWI